MGNNNEEKEDIEDWRDEHGQPSFEFLQSLANDSSPESLEKLRSIAEDLDVDYDEETSAEVLVDKIMLETQNGTDATT
jgi:hypothetical protein